MPIREKTKLILGRGELFFDRIAPGATEGEGERYVGNTTSVRIERTVERLTRKTSYGGRVHEIPGAVVSEQHKVTVMTDNVDMENLAAWFGTSPAVTGVQAGVPNRESIMIRRGRFFQIGKSLVPILGVRNLAWVVVRRNGSIVSPIGNYEVELETGRINIFPGAANLSDGHVIDITYQLVVDGENYTHAYPTLTPDANEVHGALRFVPTNIVGPRVRYYWPYVRIAPRGQSDLKGDEFQQWGFDVTPIKLNPATPIMFVEGDQDPALRLPNADTLRMLGITEGEFTSLEDVFDMIINTRIPTNLG